MSYIKWFQTHSQKHSHILKKLKNLSKTEIIDYFEFENLSKQEQNFCPLFSEAQKCHNSENLNCYLCGCPNFRVYKNPKRLKSGKLLYSYCKIESKDGKKVEFKNQVHQDCSRCNTPHKRDFIDRNFKLNWSEIMKFVIE